ncbi:MAG: dihydrofolate reductase [Ginsengibacter sp.]
MTHTDSKANNNSIEFAHMVAASTNNVIGKNNQLPWKLPNDFKYFKNKTWGLTVIMGRKTYESLQKPLPGRYNIVITKNEDWSAEGVTVAHTLQDGLSKAKETDCKKVFIIGGAEIFKQTINTVDTIYITRVEGEFEGDAFYPALNFDEWEMISEDEHQMDEKHAYNYAFQIWKKKDKPAKV